jgi:hypothetical protein
VPVLVDECATLPIPIDVNRFLPDIQTGVFSGRPYSSPAWVYRPSHEEETAPIFSTTDIRTIGWEERTPESVKKAADRNSRERAFRSEVITSIIRSLQVSPEGNSSRRLWGELTFARRPRGQDSKWRALLGRLRSLVNLADGWDSYRAPAPQSDAISHAECFLNQLSRADVLPSRLSPSVVGGIGVTFREGQRKSYVEFYNNGTVYALFSDGESEPTTQQVEPTENGYARLLAEIRNYLNA